MTSKVTHYSEGIDGIMVTAIAPSGECHTALRGSHAEAVEEILDRLAAYDSKADTLEHIGHVRNFLGEMAAGLIERARKHDLSKLEDPEKAAFDIATPKLKSLVYGSEEYKQSLADLGPALQHHYAANSHHPEHYKNGVAGMDLLDLVEMLCDWKAASMRTKGGSIADSLDVSGKRFSLDPQLISILRNTAERLGW